MSTTLTQRSAEWYAARCGSLGASDIADALARTRTGWSVSRGHVMNRIIIERLTGKTVQTYATWAMREGIEREPEARLAYMFHVDVDVGDAWVYPHPSISGAHASPDGFVGKDGLVQIKCPQHPAHLDLLEGGATPPGYIMQVQWEMACTGRSWSDFVSYQPDFPPSMQLIVRRIERDDQHIGELEAQVRVFLEETEARLQALLTAYEPEAMFAKAANAVSGRAQQRQPHHHPVSSTADEQRAKEEFAAKNPGMRNPYCALPQMRLLTYQMPDELVAIASAGEFDEFDLNEFFAAAGTGKGAQFKHKSDVQKWLDIIRGQYAPKAVESLKTGTRPPFPYSDVRLLPYLQHSFWFLPNVAACHAMANLLAEKHNTLWRAYEVVVAAGAAAGIGLDALPPVRKAIGSGFETKTITLSCGKLTTGVTVPQWSSILMLRNLKSPETYFQAAFRVQSPWSIKNPNGDNPNEEEILKPVCFVFDFAPTRALRQLSEYGIGLSPNEPNPENAVKDLVSFLPVLAYDGANMTQIDAGGILDIAMAGTSATLLARKWESALLVNVDNDTLRRILDNPEAMAAVERIEGWRSLGDNIIETIINKSEKVKELKGKAKSEMDEEGEPYLTPEERDLLRPRKRNTGPSASSFRTS